MKESEDHVEFKSARHNYPYNGGKHTDPRDRCHCVLGYIVALANERGGLLVLGMQDKMPHLSSQELELVEHIGSNKTGGYQLTVKGNSFKKKDISRILI